jgi:hypothetical protein
VDELTAKNLQIELEEKISDWSLQRLRWDRRLKHTKIRMIVMGSLILLLQAIHIFVPQLIIPPYNSLTTLALSIWFVVLVTKYSIRYIDKNYTRSADQIVKLAAEYNEAVKDIPNARRCDFLPPEMYERKRFEFRKRVDLTAPTTSLPIHAAPRV